MSIEPLIKALASPFLSSNNIGLGNVLFQISAVYGISRKYNLSAYYTNVVEYSDTLKSRFGIDLTFNILRNFLSPCSTDVSREVIQGFVGVERHYDNRLIELILENPTKNYIIDSYLENIDYFNAYADDIKTLFSPTESCLDKIRELIPKIYDSEIIPVSIHFRSLFNTLDDKYYTSAVNYIKENVKNSHFIIFGDCDPNQYQTMFGLLEGEYTQVNSIPQELCYLELYALGQCAHHIVSKSTFCFWGVYTNLNPTKIIVQSSSMSAINWYENVILV